MVETDNIARQAPCRRVGLVAKPHLQEASGVLTEIVRWLEARGASAVFDAQTAALCGSASTARTIADGDQFPREVDLIVVLGGDGTLLATAGRIAHADADVPILGVNFGSLGFLTEVTLGELYPALDMALAGRSAEDPRLMLEVRIEASDRMRGPWIALNDIVISRGALSRMIDLDVTVDGQPVARFKSDGLIVASPTGSTAYNLSAGGPIVHPSVPAMVLTPIAPHTLTNRPVVIPAKSTLRVQGRRESIADDGSDVYVTVDGQVRVPLPPTDVATVTYAPKPLRLLRPTARTYFDVLREKLKWAER
ncbi:MAG: NAD(+) kinase [Luteitalea sp.]|nr:NAD(+) kinase [Luteitalea sp.]